MTPIEFLLARIAEDESVALAVLPEGRPLERGAAVWRTSFGGTIGDLSGHVVVYRMESDEARKHIVRHDPARVLAECEAKRRIVDLHPPRYLIAYDPAERLVAEAFDSPSIKAHASSGPIYDPELMTLALPYADHPDYQDEWRV